MSLYKKYRPSNLDEIVGNKEIIASLQKLVKKKTIPQTILFTGETGCGKTTLARILAKELKAKNSLIELDSAQFNGIDVIRDIRKKSRFIPIDGGAKVFIIDEVHQLSRQAMEGFLKELEDTPKNVYYFLCTTNPEKLLPTIKGRCIQYQLDVLSDKDMRYLLERVAAKEKEDVNDKVYKAIIKKANGHPRNALNLLQQTLSVPSKKRIKVIETFEQEENDSIELCRSLIKQEGFKAAQTILKGLKTQNAESIRRHVLGYCQSVLLGNNYKDSHRRAAMLVEEFSTPTYDSGFVSIVAACYSYYYSE